MLPVFSAASCRRREAVIDRRTSSPTTQERPPKDSPSSIADSTSSSRSLSQKTTRSGCRPACEIAGKNRSGRVMHHKTLPLVRAATPAENSAAAAPSTVPPPPPAPSCNAPKASPPPGSARSTSVTSKGRACRERCTLPSRRPMRSRSSASTGLRAWLATAELLLLQGFQPFFKLICSLFVPIDKLSQSGLRFGLPLAAKPLKRIQ